MEEEIDLLVDNGQEDNNPPSNENIGSRSAGNGYGGIRLPNRNKTNYNDRIARNMANLNAARMRVNKNRQKKEKLEEANESSKDKNLLDKAGDKLPILKNTASLLSNRIGKSKANIKEAVKDEVMKAVKKKVITWVTSAIISVLPTLLPIFGFMIILFGIFGGAANVSHSGNGSSGGINGEECGFTIYDTSFSKTEFKNKISEYANSHSQWQIFADNVDDYYDYAKAKGVNPEVVVLIAYKENNGFETTPGTNNYWGWGCPNGAKKCDGLFDFMYGAKKVVDSASKWDTLMDWFVKGHYSWIGDYWYNPGSSGLGGCYYAPHIYPNNMPDRVQNACASGNVCDGNGCVKTLEEDQVAYSKWLVYTKMAEGRKSIFGLENSEGVSCSSSAVEGDGVNTGTMTHPCPGLTRISSRFGPRSQPLPGASTYHKGIDLAAPQGTPVYAADGGKVTFAQYNGNAGKHIKIDHGNGLVTEYMHLHTIGVSVGDSVSKGQQIGAVGSTGNSTGNHLHFGVIKDGLKVNPETYISF